MKSFVQEYGFFLVSLIATVGIMGICYFLMGDEGYSSAVDKLIAEISGVHYSDIEDAKKVMKEYGLKIEVN